MKYRLAIMLAVLGLCTAVRTAAQDAAQTLQPLQPVEGNVAAGEQQTWTFNAIDDSVFSFVLQSTGDTLDPQFTITTSAGAALIGNDDFDYPANRDARLEAITIPRADTYTLAVSGFGKSFGEYQLTMLPGFSEINTNISLDGNTAWRPLNDALALERRSRQELSLTLTQPAQTGIAVQAGINAPADYYAQVDVEVSGQPGWMVGMAARRQEDGQYYLLTINEQGQWRFILTTAGEDRVLRDWTPHPAIIPGKTDFTLGMLVNGRGFDFFYNGKAFGRVVDSTLPQNGQLGLAIETVDSLTPKTAATFKRLILTTPVQANTGNTVPQQLLVSSGSAMVQELQRRRVIPAEGKMELTLSESANQSSRPGVIRLPLAKGVTYQNFVMGATVRWQTAANLIAGCGLTFRASEETAYTLAYLDQTGGFGVSQRIGDTFKPGIFGELPNLKGNSHHLVIVAQANQLLYFIDGVYRGKLENAPDDGGVGIAVVNFEPTNTICTFNDTWIWRITS